MTKPPDDTDDWLALVSEVEVERRKDPALDRVTLIKSTLYQPTTELPPIGTLVRVKVDCKVSQYDHVEGIKDVQAQAGDVGVVESHGAFVKEHYCLARVRMFRLGILVGVSMKSLSGERWEVLDG